MIPYAIYGGNLTKEFWGGVVNLTDPNNAHR